MILVKELFLSSLMKSGGEKTDGFFRKNNYNTTFLFRLSGVLTGVTSDYFNDFDELCNISEVFMKRVFCMIFIFSMLLAAVSCGEDKKGVKVVVKEEVAREVSADEGGTVTTSDDSVSIEIPADALESDTNITITVYETSAHSTKKGETRVSQVIECGPSGTVFKKPVIIRMKTDKAIKNKVVAAAVYDEAKGEWSYSEHGAYAVLMGNDAAGDPIMQTAAGDPIMLNAAGDPIMQSTGENLAAAGDPIMLTSAGDPIMTNAAGDPIMNAAAGDPIMMTTGHFTAYTFIALEQESEAEVPENDSETADSDTDGETEDEDRPYIPECGNGILDEGEECDNGPDSNELRASKPACRPNCTLVRCGDSIVDEGEECDKGEENGSSDCVYGQKSCKVCTDECKEETGYTSFCGDNYVDEDNGEVCDHGADNGRTECYYGEESCELCTTSCQPVIGKTSYCGDSIVDASNGETCDEGSLNGTYGHCSAWCDGRAPYCGDGYVDEDEGETCDDGADNGSYGHCNATCSGFSPYCGDGNIDSSNGEVCDKGELNGEVYCAYGQTSCTVCNGECQEEAGVTSFCGDNYVDEDHGETCDHGADNGRTKCSYGEENCELCTTSCQTFQGETSFCGDGMIDESNEEICDDGANNGVYGHCNSSCSGRAPYCGDGYVDEDEGETCDDGADNGSYGHCNATCSGFSPYCGDGNIDSSNGEVCDNGVANDEIYCDYGQTSCTVCNGDCQEEAGVTSYCGDGYVDEDHGETCDHGEDNGRTKCYYGEENCELCTTACQTFQGETSFCGDGMIDESNDEICDDGANNGVYGHCNSSCSGRAPYCGDGYVDEDEGETCDDGADNGTYGHCNATCNGRSPYCGDGNIDSSNGETCDNGELNGTSDCAYGETKCTVCNGECQEEPGNTSYCGDNYVDEDHGEACDNGDENGRTECYYGEESCELCTTGCQIVQGVTSFCGDGGIDEENDEICDEGSLNGTEGHCNEWCDGFVCPEGYEWNGEECEGPEQDLPECSPTSGTPCYDPESEITWSAKSADQMTWDNAVSHCENLEEGGYDDWRLPNIDELRTLVQDCAATEPGGTCGVTTSCLSYSDCWSSDSCQSCSSDSSGGHSKFGETSYLWSSSVQPDDSNYRWSVLFYDGSVSGSNVVFNSYVRCVRSDYEPQTDPCEPNPCFGIENSNYECMSEGDIYMCGCEDGFEWNEEECAPMTVQTECTDLPDNAEWNFSGVVLQTWNGEDWEPEAIAYYSEDAGTYEDCSFKCTQGYVWNEEECVEPMQQLPECSPTSGTPCIDSESTLTWSAKSSSTMDWENAGSYCENLTEGGYDDWRLPNIDELRTLIQECEGTQTGGSCGVTESCLSSSDCFSSDACLSCSSDSTGGHSKFGEIGNLWSSSTRSDNTDVAWGVIFEIGTVIGYTKSDDIYVRCVR